MKKELDMRLLNQIAGGADEKLARIVLEPVFTMDAEEDNTNTRWRKRSRLRPRTNTATLEPDEGQHLILDAILVP